MENNRDEMIRRHYEYFLTQTAVTLGISAAEVAKMQGFQTAEEAMKFIDYMVTHYGVMPEKTFAKTPENAVPGIAELQAIAILKDLKME